MAIIRSLASGTAMLLLAGCVPPPPSPAVMAVPGRGKSLTVFQQDDRTCADYGAGQAGLPSPTLVDPTATPLAVPANSAATPAPPPPPPVAATAAQRRAYEISYVQCMVAHGNSVQPVPVATDYTPYYPYPTYPYPIVQDYGYPTPYPFFYGAYYGGFYGGGFGYGGYWRNGWRGGVWGGWHRGWYGAGGGRGGWHGGGWRR